MTEFTAKVRRLIRSVPRGRVATYGQIAALAGNPRGARAVSWILHSAPPDAGLPWHRIVGVAGKISLKGEGGIIQRELLAAEGVDSDSRGRIDIKAFGWTGDAPEDII